MSALPPGVYKVDPQTVLKHVITLTLGVSAGLEQRGALQTIGNDNALGSRAADAILRHFLRAMASANDPTHADYLALLDELCNLTRES